MTTYPNGYGTQMVSIERMRELHEPRMHPEFARRFFPYIQHRGGLLGVGGGYRTAPAPGGAPLANSFHWTQQFASGLYVYCAVDLVVADPPRVHRAPTWAETADAPTWGLHTFIKSPTPEPWHMQCIEMRGWLSWVNTGRHDPVTGFPLPISPTPPPSGRMIDMYRANYRLDRWPGAFECIVSADAVIHSQSGNRGKIDAKAGVPVVPLERQGIVDLLEDIGLVHKSYDPATGLAQNPFSATYDNGNYHDTELELLWSRRMTSG